MFAQTKGVKVFARLFQNGVSPPQRAKFLFWRFSFDNAIRVAICGELASLFSFCAYMVKRKSG